MNRGELWTVAGGVYASKPRPALVIQDDRFDVTDSVTVLPLTTNLIDAPLLRVSVSASELSGLRQESHVMIDKLTTVRRSNMQSRVGRLTSAQLVEIERALLVFLGLAG
ncbi:toxin MazF [Arthrobacter sp. Hiyo8]|uniref:type II toxin-antitoxin system PemK/MazF family toxin n=1 Tax=Arthrobacter sp. Hiyo1 TaxID=1588020 RepID=UPI000683832E|nr:type II toxin-antitoxin system PemK/MazF family toxin [Arthrobacter sp. Hiyo1]BAS15993.1 toxin MazF [Arthrobacter sp. Hiyo8]GAP60367.1 toxin MazF [Arthrobacter sp. Hiyo1]